MKKILFIALLLYSISGNSQVLQFVGIDFTLNQCISDYNAFSNNKKIVNTYYSRINQKSIKTIFPVSTIISNDLIDVCVQQNKKIGYSNLYSIRNYEIKDIIDIVDTVYIPILKQKNNNSNQLLFFAMEFIDVKDGTDVISFAIYMQVVFNTSGIISYQYCSGFADGCGFVNRWYKSFKHSLK